MRKPALTLKIVILSAFVAAVLACAFMPISAYAAGDTLRFMDKNGDWRTMARDEAIDITNAETTKVLEGGKTYIVTNDADFCYRLDVRGDVTFVIFGNAKVTARDGIRCAKGNSITITSQQDTENAALGGFESLMEGQSLGAAIGGNSDEEGGEIALCSCNVRVRAGMNAAGIGGGWCSNGGKTIIRNAKVSAESCALGAAIGGGGAGPIHDGGDGGEVLIVDSVVRASTSEMFGNGGAGIGGGGDGFHDFGDQGNGGKVTIMGNSTVDAQGDDGAAIGRGDDEGEVGTVTLSDNLKVTDMSEHVGLVATFPERAAYCLWRNHVVIEPGESRA